MLLQYLVGGAAFLVAGWLLWLTWITVRSRPWRWPRVAALVALSVTLLLALTLRESDGGGLAGEALLQLLDAAFGRTGGLAIVSIAAAIALVSLIGFERIVHWLIAV